MGPGEAETLYTAGRIRIIYMILDEFRVSLAQNRRAETVFFMGACEASNNLGVGDAPIDSLGRCCPIDAHEQALQ